MDGATDGLSLVAAEVVHDDDVAGFKRRHENLLDISKEALAVDRAVENEGGVDPVVSQRCEEGQRSPVPMRHLGEQLVSSRSPAAKARHVGLGPGLVDDDQPRWIKPALMHLPAQAPSCDVGAILFGGEQSFF